MTDRIYLGSKLQCSFKEQPTMAYQEAKPVLGAVWLEDLIVGQRTPNKRWDGVVGGRAGSGHQSCEFQHGMGRCAAVQICKNYLIPVSLFPCSKMM